MMRRIKRKAKDDEKNKTEIKEDEKNKTESKG